MDARPALVCNLTTFSGSVNFESCAVSAATPIRAVRRSHQELELRLTAIDWLIVASSIALTLAIGIASGKRAGQNSAEYFLSGRSMGWGLLGISMVATTFSTDTPNLVAGLTRQHGVAGNWSWWAFCLTTMTTAFFFGGLWRRSGVSTDNEFYEFRYSGREATFLRAFRSIYLGVLINVLIMGGVTLALTKFSSVLFGLPPVYTVLIAGSASVILTAVGGLRGVVISDFFLFIIAMIGAFAAAYFALAHPDVGGVGGLFAHSNVRDMASFFPSANDPATIVSLLLIPLLVQWWSVWYPGAEPGGGGFVAQRMFAAKDERNAVGAITLFAFAHYVVRPWPWIVVALASLIVYPDLASMRTAFPDVDARVVSDDFAYPAMLVFVPPVWLGIVAASLVGAYLSTIGTTLNLGASYMVYDIYARFVNPKASEREKVLAGRLVTVGLMAMTGIAALTLKSSDQVFRILLSVGAGTGLLYMLRWYWPRINAWSEISAMIFALLFSLGVPMLSPFGTLPVWAQLVVPVLLTTTGWVVVTLISPRTDEARLLSFYEKVRPPGPAWRKYALRSHGTDGINRRQSGVGAAFTCLISGTAMIYGALYLIGATLKAKWLAAGVMALCLVILAIVFWYGWQRLDLSRQEFEESSA